MSQHDFSIANQTFPSFRADLNSGLEALATLSSGATEPSTTYAHQLWVDLSANQLKIRKADNSGWLSIAYIEPNTAYRVLEDTQVVDTDGDQQGVIGGQETETWSLGSGELESLISPAKLKQVAVSKSVAMALLFGS
jgi:hypothetical protein